MKIKIVLILMLNGITIVINSGPYSSKPEVLKGKIKIAHSEKLQEQRDELNNADCIKYLLSDSLFSEVAGKELSRQALRTTLTNRFVYNNETLGLEKIEDVINFLFEPESQVNSPISFGNDDYEALSFQLSDNH